MTNTAAQNEQVRTVHLQGIGAHVGKEAGSLQVGDVIVWNYGYMSEVISIDAETAKTIVVTVRASDGKNYSRRFNKTRAVAIAKK